MPQPALQGQSAFDVRTGGPELLLIIAPGELCWPRVSGAPVKGADPVAVEDWVAGFTTVSPLGEHVVRVLGGEVEDELSDVSVCAEAQNASSSRTEAMWVMAGPVGLYPPNPPSASQ